MLTKMLHKPRKRTFLRYKAAVLYHSGRRYVTWLAYRRQFAREKSAVEMPHLCFHHETMLLRQLKDVDMALQYNKITNLNLAAQRLNGIVIHPGETFSYWKLIGKPTYGKGYLDGVVLRYGQVISGCGGGLCQLSNLIYWMTLHTPLTVIERHRHGYDVFPDAARTQPFGSGATCFYPYGDLMIKNETDADFQLLVHVSAEHLIGEWRSDRAPEYQYKIVEREHCFSGEYWGGFSRHNALYRQTIDLDGAFLCEDFITENHALMMYSPFIESSRAEIPD